MRRERTLERAGLNERHYGQDAVYRRLYRRLEREARAFWRAISAKDRHGIEA
jgi:hypothetical protein